MSATSTPQESNIVADFNKRRKRHGWIVLATFLSVMVLTSLLVDWEIGLSGQLKVLIPLIYVAVVVFAYTNYRCPKCKGSLFFTFVTPEFCPHCHVSFLKNESDVAGQREEVLADVFANLDRGVWFEGGLLKITDRHILFRPHVFNLPMPPAEILFNDILEIRKCNIMGLIPNGMMIKTKAGVRYRFSSWGRQKLISIIESKMRKA